MESTGRQNDGGGRSAQQLRVLGVGSSFVFSESSQQNIEGNKEWMRT